MKSIIGNLILIIALSAVIIMIIGIFLYDFIPTGVTVAEANTYEVKESTTKILSEINDNSQNLPDNNSDASNSNLILQTYSVTKNDLEVYEWSGAYEKGKANPFADVSIVPNGTDNTTSTPGSTGNTSSGNANNGTGNSETSNTGNTNSVTTDLKPNTSDGTLFNSTTSK